MASRKGPGIPPSRRGRGGDGDEGGRDRAPSGPPGYERKFAEFIRMCGKGKEGVDVAFIDHPSVIGDNYAEIIGGLSRLADAGMGLRIVRREPARSPSGGKSLPRPTVSVPEHGDDPSKFGAAGIKGMVVNPIYAGVADYPKMIPDEEWVGAVTKVIEEDGAEQFLVNLLYVLRRTFGCVEWDGHLPPDVN